VGADIEHSHPEARNDLVKWGKWIIDEVDACGFRFDAVKVHSRSFLIHQFAQFEQHIDRNFMADFIKTTRSETGKPQLFALGEFWKDSYDDLANYVDALGTQVRIVPSFPLRFSPMLTSDI
jgi:alpha-amylase